MRTSGAKNRPKFITVTLEQLNQIYNPKAKIKVHIQHALHFLDNIDQFQRDEETTIGLLKALLESPERFEGAKKGDNGNVEGRRDVPMTIIEFDKEN